MGEVAILRQGRHEALAPRRRPAFRCAHLETLVPRVIAGGVSDARSGDRVRAVRAALALDQVAALPSPGLALVAASGAARVLAALGHPRPLRVVAGRDVARRAAEPRA